MQFSLHNTPFADGTTVYAYDATGYPSGFPGANPPGDPVETVEASNFSVTFSEVEDGVPYVAAGKVGGDWRYIRFMPDAATQNPLVAHEAATTAVHGIPSTAELVTVPVLNAALALPPVTLFYADFASTQSFEFFEEQANPERVTIVEDPIAGRVAHFEVKEGDPEVAGGNRAEIVSGRRYVAGMDLLFSFKIKAEAVFWEKFHISWQLHDETGGSPPICFMYKQIAGKKYLWIGPGDSSETWWKFELSDEGKGWVDLAIRVKLGADDGELEVWKDGELQTLESGGTIKTGLNTLGAEPEEEGVAQAVYDKCGLYRSKDATGASKTRIGYYGVTRRLVTV